MWLLHLWIAMVMGQTTETPLPTVSLLLRVDLLLWEPVCLRLLPSNGSTHYSIFVYLHVTHKIFTSVYVVQYWYKSYPYIACSMSFSTVPPYVYITKEGTFNVSVLILLSLSLLVTMILLPKLGAAATSYCYTGLSGFCLSVFCFSSSTDY
jgi:hypothetical protein